MRVFIVKKNILLLTILFICVPAVIEAQPIAVKLNLGTPGIGLEAAYQVSEPLNVRLGGSFMSASYLYETDPDDEFDVDTSMNLGMFSALADWHPFENSFRLTGGLVYNNNRINAVLLPKQSYTIGGDTYSPEDLGQLDSKLSFNALAPYLALGFGNAFKGSSVGFNVDLGLIYQGKPKVDLVASGALAPSAEQAPILEENLSWATVYPILNLSVYYRIGR